MSPTQSADSAPPASPRTAAAGAKPARRIRRAMAMPLHDDDPDGVAASALIARAQAVAAGSVTELSAGAGGDAADGTSNMPDLPSVYTFRPDAGGSTARSSGGRRTVTGAWPLMTAAAVAGAVLVSVPLLHKESEKVTDLAGHDQAAPVATIASDDGNGHTSSIVPDGETTGKPRLEGTDSSASSAPARPHPGSSSPAAPDLTASGPTGTATSTGADAAASPDGRPGRHPAAGATPSHDVVHSPVMANPPAAVAADTGRDDWWSDESDTGLPSLADWVPTVPTSGPSASTEPSPGAAPGAGAPSTPAFTFPTLRPKPTTPGHAPAFHPPAAARATTSSPASPATTEQPAHTQARVAKPETESKAVPAAKPAAKSGPVASSGSAVKSAHTAAASVEATRMPRATPQVKPVASANAEAKRTPSVKPEANPVPSAKPVSRPVASKSADAKPTQVASASSDAKRTSPVKPVSKPAQLAAPSNQGWETKVFTSPFELKAGGSVASNRLRITMQTNGNLVISNQHGAVVWSSHTQGAGNRADFQGDGNLVVSDASGKALWSTGTGHTPGAKLVLQMDGNVTILSSSDAVLWAAGTENK